MVKFASCQYAIELFGGWDAYAAHLEALVAEAVGEGAELLLLPEYSARALAGLLPEAERSDLHGSIAGMQPFIPRWLELCEAMARRHLIWFCPGLQSCAVPLRLSSPGLQPGLKRLSHRFAIVWLFCFQLPNLSILF